MIFADLALARLIEGANAEALFEHPADILVGATHRLFPELCAESVRIAGGVMSFIEGVENLSYAVGMGLNGPVSADDIARVVDFFRSHGAVPRVGYCPLADESLGIALRKHNFMVHDFVSVLARPLSVQDEFAPAPQEIRVREAEPDEGELWTRVVYEGFADGQPMTEPDRHLGMIIFHSPTTRAYFAEISGEPVGAGAIFVRGSYAALLATSVRAPFRNRGAHGALIRARLAKARDLGCTLAGFFAAPGSTSHRNAERHGFRVMYTKAIMKPNP
jgi:GNAT superfamily N-acetyltransferase